MDPDGTCGNCGSDEIEYFGVETKEHGTLVHACCCECGEEWIE